MGFIEQSPIDVDPPESHLLKAAFELPRKEKRCVIDDPAVRKILQRVRKRANRVAIGKNFPFDPRQIRRLEAVDLDEIEIGLSMWANLYGLLFVTRDDDSIVFQRIKER